MIKFEMLKSLIGHMESDVEKFYKKGNKAAGTRIRYGMQQVRSLTKEIRDDVQVKKGIKKAK